ncbi:hypothetical protein DdX_15262 [Ditylenchus destructor]|uniref:Uncharacterized protein n=1 Tax=Ditylenchus destructor TaxID=166010 RepID=A0AAD4MVM5_9BILA|nr:hypothetical protein DdX_15262 [Ditylenchus destructor]
MARSFYTSVLLFVALSAGIFTKLTKCGQFQSSGKTSISRGNQPASTAPAEPEIKILTPDQIVDEFDKLKSDNDEIYTVYSVLGLSSDYVGEVIGILNQFLDSIKGKHVIINSGATSSGVGVVYKLAAERPENERKNWILTGIVASQGAKYVAKEYIKNDHVFYTAGYWGGVNPDNGNLFDASAAIVQVSDIIITVGGGPVAMIEMFYAKLAGKIVIKHESDETKKKNEKPVGERGHLDAYWSGVQKGKSIDLEHRKNGHYSAAKDLLPKDKKHWTIEDHNAHESKHISLSDLEKTKAVDVYLAGVVAGMILG